MKQVLYDIATAIVNNPDKAREVLIDAGFSSMLTDVLIIKIPHVAGSLQTILEVISNNGVNIEYMYGLSVEAEDASVVMKTNDLPLECEVLKKANIGTMSIEEIANA